jgi:hypothetical protein
VFLRKWREQVSGTALFNEHKVLQRLDKSCAEEWVSCRSPIDVPHKLQSLGDIRMRPGDGRRTASFALSNAFYLLKLLLCGLVVVSELPEVACFAVIAAQAIYPL